MAIRFDASGEYLLRTTGLPPIASWTGMGWFYLAADTNQYATCIAFGDAPGTGNFYSLGTFTDGLTIASWNGVDELTGTTLSLGVWYHLAITVAGTGAGQYKLYLNGAVDITSDGFASVTAAQLYVGTDSGNVSAHRLDGGASALKFWDVALTQAEIQQEMLTIRPQRFASLNAWYPCFFGSGERARDYSGLGRNWTENGTLTDEDGPPVSWGASVWIPPYFAAAAPALASPRVMRALYK